MHNKKKYETYADYRNFINKHDTIEEIKRIKDRVMYILMDYPKCRDSYRALLARYYHTFFPYNHTFKSPYHWIVEAPQPTTIIRSRSLLQKWYPEIRGEHYEERISDYENTRENWYGSIE